MPRSESTTSVARLIGHRFWDWLCWEGRTAGDALGSNGCWLLRIAFFGWGWALMRIHVLEGQADCTWNTSHDVGGRNQRIIEHPSTNAPNYGTDEVGRHQQGGNWAAVFGSDHSWQTHQDWNGTNEAAKGWNQACDKQRSFHWEHC